MNNNNNNNNQQPHHHHHVFWAIDPLSVALALTTAATAATAAGSQRKQAANNNNIITMTAEECSSATTTTASPVISPEEAVMGDKITALGEAIKEAKTAKKPQEEWNPILQEMLVLKQTYKETFGKDFGSSNNKAADAEKKKGESQQEASDKNKAKNEEKARQKAEREAKKVAQRAEREAREKEKAQRLAAESSQASNFGDAPLVQSQHITPGKQWLPIAHITPKLQNQSVLVRGHLQTVRAVGKGVFVLIRSSLYSVQGVAFENTNTNSSSTTPLPISQAMIKYIAGLPLESVVDVQGIVTLPIQPIDGATQKLTEIQITHFYCICKATQTLPFQMDDACRPDLIHDTDVGEYNEDAIDEAEAKASADDGMIRVGPKVRADYRWLDLRTPANQSIMRIESMVGCLFRECLISKGFIEIHTPKIIGGASEGGSEVFTLDYFGQHACLAMSPQLHKQMTAACSGFERVYETGPVFRAENSNTRRHLCEFTGLDLEMVIHEHYDEILQVFSDLFISIFDGLNERCRAELERVREQHPFEDLQYLRPTLKLTYAEGCALLRGAGVQQDEYEDLSTVNEKKLGNIVKEKYGTDFFFMDKYPLAVRPFYTMPDPNKPKLSNSYDFFIRGQEILSGAQRIHEPELLQERAKAWNINLKDIESYVNSFRHGALPHGGGGIGLERVVMLFLDLPNIRKASWFPRDPKRIAP